MKQINCISNSNTIKECDDCDDKSQCLELVCSHGCKMCGGGGNFSQPMNNGRRTGCSNYKCIEFTQKTNFACGYKCGWKGPQFWNFSKNGLQWGQHVGGDGSRICKNYIPMSPSNKLPNIKFPSYIKFLNNKYTSKDYSFLNLITSKINYLNTINEPLLKFIIFLQLEKYISDEYSKLSDDFKVVLKKTKLFGIDNKSQFVILEDNQIFHKSSLLGDPDNNKILNVQPQYLIRLVSLNILFNGRQLQSGTTSQVQLVQSKYPNLLRSEFVEKSDLYSGLQTALLYRENSLKNEQYDYSSQNPISNISNYNIRNYDLLRSYINDITNTEIEDNNKQLLGGIFDDISSFIIDNIKDEIIIPIIGPTAAAVIDSTPLDIITDSITDAISDTWGELVEKVNILEEIIGDVPVFVVNAALNITELVIVKSIQLVAPGIVGICDEKCIENAQKVVIKAFDEVIKPFFDTVIRFLVEILIDTLITVIITAAVLALLSLSEIGLAVIAATELAIAIVLDAGESIFIGISNVLKLGLRRTGFQVSEGTAFLQRSTKALDKFKNLKIFSREVKTLEEEVAGVKSAVTNQKSLLSDLESQLPDIEDSLTPFQLKVEEQAIELREAEKNLENFEKNVEILRKRVETTRGELSVEKLKLKTFEKKTAETNTKILAVQKKIEQRGVSELTQIDSDIAIAADKLDLINFINKVKVVDKRENITSAIVDSIIATQDLGGSLESFPSLIAKLDSTNSFILEQDINTLISELIDEFEVIPEDLTENFSPIEITDKLKVILEDSEESSSSLEKELDKFSGYVESDSLLEQAKSNLDTVLDFDEGMIELGDQIDIEQEELLDDLFFKEKGIWDSINGKIEINGDLKVRSGEFRQQAEQSIDPIKKAIDNKQSLISRIEELDEVAAQREAKITKTSTELAELEAELEVGSPEAISKLESQISNVEENLRGLAVNQDELGTTLINLNQNLEIALDQDVLDIERIENLKFEISNVEQNIEDINLNINIKNNDLTKLRDDLEIAREAGSEDNVAKLTQQIAEKQGQLSNIKNTREVTITKFLELNRRNKAKTLLSDNIKNLEQAREELILFQKPNYAENAAKAEQENLGIQIADKNTEITNLENGEGTQEAIKKAKQELAELVDQSDAQQIVIENFIKSQKLPDEIAQLELDVNNLTQQIAKKETDIIDLGGPLDNIEIVQVKDIAKEKLKDLGIQIAEKNAEIDRLNKEGALDSLIDIAEQEFTELVNQRDAQENVIVNLNKLEPEQKKLEALNIQRGNKEIEILDLKNQDTAGVFAIDKYRSKEEIVKELQIELDDLSREKFPIKYEEARVALDIQKRELDVLRKNLEIYSPDIPKEIEISDLESENNSLNILNNQLSDEFGEFTQKELEELNRLSIQLSDFNSLPPLEEELSQLNAKKDLLTTQLDTLLQDKEIAEQLKFEEVVIDTGIKKQYRMLQEIADDFKKGFRKEPLTSDEKNQLTSIYKKFERVEGLLPKERLKYIQLIGKGSATSEEEKQIIAKIEKKLESVYFKTVKKSEILESFVTQEIELSTIEKDLQKYNKTLDKIVLEDGITKTSIEEAQNRVAGNDFIKRRRIYNECTNKGRTERLFAERYRSKEGIKSEFENKVDETNKLYNEFVDIFRFGGDEIEGGTLGQLSAAQLEDSKLNKIFGAIRDDIFEAVKRGEVYPKPGGSTRTWEDIIKNAKNFKRDPVIEILDSLPKFSRSKYIKSYIDYLSEEREIEIFKAIKKSYGEQEKLFKELLSPDLVEKYQEIIKLTDQIGGTFKSWSTTGIDGLVNINTTGQKTKSLEEQILDLENLVKNIKATGEPSFKNIEILRKELDELNSIRQAALDSILKINDIEAGTITNELINTEKIQLQLEDLYTQRQNKDSLFDNLNKLKREYNELVTKANEQESAIEEISNSLFENKTGLEARLSEARFQLSFQESKIAELFEQESLLLSEKEFAAVNTRREIDKTQLEIDKLNTQISQLEKRKETALDQIRSKKEMISNLQNDVKKFNGKIAAANSAIESLKKNESIDKDNGDITSTDIRKAFPNFDFPSTADYNVDTFGIFDSIANLFDNSEEEFTSTEDENNKLLTVNTTTLKDENNKLLTENTTTLNDNIVILDLFLNRIDKYTDIVNLSVEQLKNLESKLKFTENVEDIDNTVAHLKNGIIYWTKNIYIIHDTFLSTFAEVDDFNNRINYINISKVFNQILFNDFKIYNTNIKYNDIFTLTQYGEENPNFNGFVSFTQIDHTLTILKLIQFISINDNGETVNKWVLNEEYSDKYENIKNRSYVVMNYKSGLTEDSILISSTTLIGDIRKLLEWINDLTNKISKKYPDVMDKYTADKLVGCVLWRVIGFYIIN